MKIIIFILLCFLFLITTSPTLAANLLQNSGFEDGINNWSTYGSSITASNEYAKNGNNSGKLQTSTMNSGVKYIYQTALVEPNKYYKISGFAIKKGEVGSSVFIRFAFYSTNDGSGSQIGGDSYDTNTLTTSQTDFEYLESEAIIAPTEAKSAKIRLSIQMPDGASQLGITYFDDLAFEQVEAPTPTPTNIPTPTSTPTPTDVPTPTHTPTPIKTPTPTKTPTPKPTTKPSPTSTSNNSNNETENPNLPSSILGTSSSAPLPTISQDSVKDQNPESPLTKIFFIGGGITILLAGGLFYTFLSKRKSNLT